MKIPGLRSLHLRTFARAALIPYIGGTIAHGLRLIYDFPLVEAPFWIHYAIVLVGGYAVIGFIAFAAKVRFTGTWDKLLYSLVIIHLGSSVVLHLFSILSNSNEWMAIFPLGYSYFALVYFIGLGVYVYSLKNRIIGS